MKTLQELFDEIETNDELKNRFAEAANSEKVMEFLKEQGCDATSEELEAFIKEKAGVDGDTELDLDELDNVAGGRWFKDVYQGILRGPNHKIMEADKAKGRPISPANNNLGFRPI